jgi:hypothetical protein
MFLFFIVSIFFKPDIFLENFFFFRKIYKPNSNPEIWNLQNELICMHFLQKEKKFKSNPMKKWLELDRVRKKTRINL